MIVCAHGDVADFCSQHEMEVFESYDGDLKNYDGDCIVVVTDQKMTREEYDSLKCTMFGMGIELVSTDWTDDSVILRLLRNQVEQRRKRGGRQMFGFQKRRGEIVEIPEMIVVARRIIEMRDAGCTLRQIQFDDDVHHRSGRMLSISTIQKIIENRRYYERK